MRRENSKSILIKNQIHEDVLETHVTHQIYQAVSLFVAQQRSMTSVFNFKKPCASGELEIRHVYFPILRFLTFPKTSHSSSYDCE